MRTKPFSFVRTITWDQWSLLVLPVLVAGHFLFWQDEFWLVPPFTPATSLIYLFGWLVLAIFFGIFSLESPNNNLNVLFAIGALATIGSCGMMYFAVAFSPTSSGEMRRRFSFQTECETQRFSVVRTVTHCTGKGWYVGYVFLPVMHRIHGANLNGASLVNIDLEDANLHDVTLRGADLRGANLREASLETVDLRGANLQGADLSGAYMRNMQIDADTEMDDADLLVWEVLNKEIDGLMMVGLDLRGAYLKDAYLVGADLSFANLSGAKVGGANFENANLQNADLSNIDTGSSFNRPNFNGANLKGANLSGVDLEDLQINQFTQFSP